MGILNLLKEFAPIVRDVHLCDFRSRTIGIDSMCWLHRSAFCCSTELVRSQYDSSVAHPTRYLLWLRKMCRMLIHFGITPIFVFDGAALPSKQVTNDARDRQRAEWKKKGDALYEQQGKEFEANDAYSKCISITNVMIRNFQHLLKQEGCQYIIAPYESDAQLGYLYRTGKIYAALTEDSDLLPYGCRKIMIKLTKEGDCKLIDLDDFEKQQWNNKTQQGMARLKRILMHGREERKEEQEYANAIATSAAAAALSDANTVAAASSAAPAAASSSSSASILPSPPPISLNFIHACVLSGCDYLPSLHGIGLKKAITWVDEFPRIDNLLYHLKEQRKKLEEKWRKQEEKGRKERKEKKDAVAATSSESQTEDDDLNSSDEPSSSRLSTSEYIFHFYKAVLVFQHQLIYDMDTREFKYLQELPRQLEERRVAGMEDGGVKVEVKNEISSRLIQPPVGAIKRQSSAGSQAIDIDLTEHIPIEFTSSVASVTASSSLTSSVTSSTSSSELPSSHPLLTVTDFSFLGPPIPSHLTSSYIRGDLDPKTMMPYSDSTEGGGAAWKPTDLAEIERHAKEEALRKKQAWQERSNHHAAPAVNHAGSINTFFSRAPSTPLHQPTPSRGAWSLSSSSSSSSMHRTKSSFFTPQKASRVKQNDEEMMNEMFAHEKEDEEELMKYEREMEEAGGMGEEEMKQESQMMMEEETRDTQPFEVYDEDRLESKLPASTTTPSVAAPSNLFLHELDTPVTFATPLKAFTNVTSVVKGKMSAASSSTSASSSSAAKDSNTSTSAATPSPHPPAVTSRKLPSSALLNKLFGMNSSTSTISSLTSSSSSSSSSSPRTSASAVPSSAIAHQNSASDIQDLTMDENSVDSVALNTSTTHTSSSSTVATASAMRFTAPSASSTSFHAGAKRKSSTLTPSTTAHNSHNQTHSVNKHVSSSSSSSAKRSKKNESNAMQHGSSLLNFFVKSTPPAAAGV